MMIQKDFIESDGQLIARLTFHLPSDVWADAIYLVGDFNNWSRTSHPFARDYAGKWALTVDLEIGRIYRFHYLCDGEHWLSDSYADANVVTPYGSDNFVIMTDPKLKQLEVTQLEG
jgi:1,4-alpha-glucan branching enzyme